MSSVLPSIPTTPSVRKRQHDEIVFHFNKWIFLLENLVPTFNIKILHFVSYWIPSAKYFRRFFNKYEEFFVEKCKKQIVEKV